MSNSQAGAWERTGTVDEATPPSSESQFLSANKMSNDINYSLKFRSGEREVLKQIKDYLTEKKRRWNSRGSQTTEALLKKTGLKHPAEVVTWGFEFEKIQEQDDGTYSIKASSWANENSSNPWISGEEGELRFLLEKFPGLEIAGEFGDEYGKGLVSGYELIYQEEDESDHEWGQNGDASYNKATTDLLLKLFRWNLSFPKGLRVKDLKVSLEQGADPNAWMDEQPLFEYVRLAVSNSDQERVKVLDLLFAHRMRLERLEDFASFMLAVPGLPDNARRFAQDNQLIRATDGETRLEVFRFLLQKQAINRMSENFLEAVGPPAECDKEIVAMAITRWGQTIAYANKALRADKKLVLLAISGPGGCGHNLKFASTELKDDLEVALEAVRKDGAALEHVSRRLRNDRRVVSAAVKSSGWALEFASKQLRADREIVLSAVKICGSVLQFASPDLRSSPDIVKAAIKAPGNGAREALQYAAPKLQKDPELKKMVQQNEG